MTEERLEKLLKEILAEVKLSRNEVRRHGTEIEEAKKELRAHAEALAELRERVSAIEDAQASEPPQ